ncbi:hypothetical protein [Rhodococcus coprophilus]|uniref:Bacteriophage protein n=1 Tax=Rhodococcus coprophilus TaxID=38310 RepID=A0A2X4UBU7_9NOCA|nr:hypothetical protein [Rhodococcus coprophilus]MBM7458569.1 hypothetical protein [Rhodococcus coprophilus]SQI32888.1 Uncharacterised protein [Rhodococcus coprophilus]
MSILNRGNETVTVYPETLTIDEDGNKFTKPSKVGIVLKAVVQPVNIGVMSASPETQKIGFETSIKYRLRLVGYPELLGAQSQVEWRGKRYALDGDPQIFSGSPRTARAEYVMLRR